MIRLNMPEAGVHVRVEIDIDDPAVREALSHRAAAPLFRCALATTLSALAMGEKWPERALVCFAGLLEEMKGCVVEERMH